MAKSVDLSPAVLFSPFAVGEPGHRVFLLVGSDLVEEITLKIEKGQLVALQAALISALSRLGRPHELSGEPGPLASAAFDWAAGALEVGVDPGSESIEVVATELSEEEPATARFVISTETAAQFTITTTRLIEGGRPPCPLCGFPLDPHGHECPRTNGHRAPLR